LTQEKLDYITRCITNKDEKIVLRTMHANVQRECTCAGSWSVTYAYIHNERDKWTS
jgi:hypothetical protein